ITVFAATAAMFAATTAFSQSNTTGAVPSFGVAAGGGYVVAPLGLTARGAGAGFILVENKKTIHFCLGLRAPQISSCNRPDTDINPGCYRVACSDSSAQLK